MTTLDALDIEHHFGGGMYAKRTLIRAGITLAQHRHKHDHLSILASGSVVLEVEGAQRVLRAPAELTIEAHKHHLVRALTDSVWYCIWPDEYDTDQARIEEPAGDMQAMAEAMAEGTR